MPYIKPKIREHFKFEGFPKNPGELNYCLTQLLLTYQAVHGLSYQTINDIIGALEGAKLEFYRRVAVPYENAKLAENGDVF